MSLADAFADDVGPCAFVEDHLEDLFEPYTAFYEKVSDVDLVVLLRLQGGDEGGEWTLVFSDLGLEVESGRTSTALLTVIGDATAWPHLRAPLHTLLTAAEASAKRHAPDDVPDKGRLTNTRLNRLEGVQGWVQVTFKNVPERGDAVLEVVFNADKPSGSPLKVDIDLPALLEAAEQGRRVSSLVKQGKISVGGDMGLSVRLMGAVA